MQAPAGLDHAGWQRLLQTYVDERGRVDYAAWKASSPDREALRQYLDRFGLTPAPPAQGHELAAALVNAYNAFTIAWVLEHYPTSSIRVLKDSFGARRHVLGGRKVSLDDIEHETLRPLLGYRVHAVLVCAARSCPPLSREAYEAGPLDRQLDAAMERWLAREDLNRFEPHAGRAHLSRIFDWFSADFEKAGGVRPVLRRHGPPAARQAADHPRFEVEYLSYDWGLNDQRAGGGRAPGALQLLWDRIRAALPSR